jgi:hypothetical protein
VGVIFNSKIFKAHFCPIFFLNAWKSKATKIKFNYRNNIVALTAKNVLIFKINFILYYFSKTILKLSSIKKKKKLRQRAAFFMVKNFSKIKIQFFPSWVLNIINIFLVFFVIRYVWVLDIAPHQTNFSLFFRFTMGESC